MSRATLHILARGPDLASGAVDGRVKVCIEVMRESDTNAVTLRTTVLPFGLDLTQRRGEAEGAGVMVWVGV